MSRNRKYHFVYRTTNKINNKVYIGVHSCNDLNDGYLGSGKALRKSITKYGKENFSREILSFFDNPEDAYDVEELIVDKDWVNDPKTYNLVRGGQRPVCNLDRGSSHFNYGRKHTDEFKKFQSDKMMGKMVGKLNPAFKGTVYVMCGLCPIAQFEYSTQASKILKIPSGSIRSCISKERETTNGFRFTRDVKSEQKYVLENGISRYEFQYRKDSKTKIPSYKNVYQYCKNTKKLIAFYKDNVEASNSTGIHIYYINKVLSGKSYSGATKGFLFTLKEIDCI